MSAGDTLNYGNLMQKAMRAMMADVLTRISDTGLPGDHHFYICFETGHPGVDIPDWLRETYPDEMTIVLQEWFRDLAVTPDRFSVTLNFSDQAQTLVIPFAAVRTFVDPSVKFGLKFDAYEPEDVVPGPLGHIGPKEDVGEEFEPDPEEEETATSAEIVSIDTFRKS